MIVFKSQWGCIPIYLSHHFNVPKRYFVVLQVLNDFDESAKRRVDDLTPYTDDLCRLFTTSRDPNVRRLALNALVRHSRSEPAFAPQHLLPSYLACLRQTSVVCFAETIYLRSCSFFAPNRRLLCFRYISKSAFPPKIWNQNFLLPDQSKHP